MKRGNLNHCKGKPPWRHAQASKIRSFKASTRLLLIVGGATALKNPYVRISLILKLTVVILNI